MPDTVSTGTDPVTPSPVPAQSAPVAPTSQSVAPSSPDLSQYDLGDTVTPGQQPGPSGDGSGSTPGAAPSAPPPDTSQYDLGDTIQAPSKPGMAQRIGETGGIPAMASAAVNQVITPPIQHYQEAIKAFEQGDTKGGLEAATKGLQSLTTFGMSEKNSPMMKIFTSLLMHPFNEFTKQRDENRRNAASAGPTGKEPSISEIMSMSSGDLQKLVDQRREQENAVTSPNGSPDERMISDIKSGNFEGAAGDIVSPLVSHAVGMVPVIGPAMQQEGEFLDQDLHDHNNRAVAGDILGPLLTAGIANRLGALSKAAGRTADNIEAARPGSINVAGEDIPMAKNNPTLKGGMKPATKFYSNFASREGAAQFVKDQAESAVRATHATLGDGALETVDQLRAARGEPLATAQQPHLADVDAATKFLKDEAQKTYHSLDQAALNDVADWESKYGPNSGYSPKAVQPSAPARPGQDPTGMNKQAITDWDAKYGQQFKPDGTVKKPIPDTPAPPKPKKFSDLQTQLDDATTTANSKFASAADRQAARAELPALKQEMEDFLVKYGRNINPNELEAANNAWKQHLRMEFLADRIRTGVKGTAEGNATIASAPRVSAQFLENLPDQFNNKYGTVSNPNAFQDLLGPRGVKNYNDIVNALQEPVTGSSGFMQWLHALPLKAGGAAIKVIPISQLADSILFNPDAGAAALKLWKVAKVTSAVEKGASAATKVAPVTGPATDPNVGRRVIVDGHPGTQVGTHPTTGKPVIVYHDKDSK